MKVLLTGSDGYIGTVCGDFLLRQGYEVTGLDTGFYRTGWLYDGVQARPEVVTRDIRTLTPDDLAGFDGLVHMAELSNDPLGQHNPELTYTINHAGTVRLAEMAKSAGVKRFVYMSSCSVYGVASQEEVDETGEVDPQTAYAECKIMNEQALAALADEAFAPTFLRNATAYGASPRMRFDLVVNDLVAGAMVTGTVKLTSDGSYWRPFVHVQDISQAIACVLAAPPELVRNEVLNVGSGECNYQIKDIADIVARTVPGCDTIVGPSGGDTRSYRVSFSKINSMLPGFRCQWTVERGASDMRDIFQRIGLTREAYEAPPYTRLKRLHELLARDELDANLFWKHRC